MNDAADGFFGNRFLAASWRPGAPPALLDRLQAAVTTWSVVAGNGWLLASERADAFGQEAEIATALSRSAAFDRNSARFRPPHDIAAELARTGISSLDGMAPPFRAIWSQTSRGVVHAATDVFGLGQVFVGVGQNAAFTSSSATLLAEVLGSGLSPEHLAGHALFGGFIGVETPFAGVDKLPAGMIATLLEGRIELTRRWSLPTATEPVAVAFREAMAAMLSAAPDAELELSGGLDSRIILAAMPPEARKGRRAITIGLADEPSEDVTVARNLANSSELDWSLLDASGLSELDASSLEALLLKAAAAYDHMANPLDKVTLILAGRNRRVDSRLGGQNGEILRGFYYPAQPLSAPPSESLARRLISMRLQANDRVEEQILSPTLRRELRGAAEARMTQALLSFDGAWGQTLDQFYLGQRMQNWVGNATGHRLMDHAPLYPFFDPAFVAAALSLAPEEKLNSRAAYQLLCDLDMGLAQRPLAGGIVPARARHSGRGNDLVLNGQRVLGRLGRLLKGRGRATLGSQTITDQWRRLKLHSCLPIDALSRTGLFDLEGLGRIASGEFAPSRPTLGFLLLMTSLEKRS